MSPTLTDPVVRRRLALGLIAFPANSNCRRRHPRKPPFDYRYALIAAACSLVMLLALMALVRVLAPLANY